MFRFGKWRTSSPKVKDWITLEWNQNKHSSCLHSWTVLLSMKHYWEVELPNCLLFPLLKIRELIGEAFKVLIP